MYHTQVTQTGPKHPGASKINPPLSKIKKRLPLRVLTPEQWQHWQRDGYLIIKNAVPQELIAPVIEMLWEFQEMDPNDPDTWYQPQRRLYEMTELNGAGMVEVFNHQSLWDVRQHPRMYDIFVDIWDREDLWVALDRANLSPPNKKARETGKVDGFIHFLCRSRCRAYCRWRNRVETSAGSNAYRRFSARSTPGGTSSRPAPIHFFQTPVDSRSSMPKWRQEIYYCSIP